MYDRRFIALLTNNTGFGSRFSCNDWQNSHHVTGPIWSCIDWPAGPKIRIVGLSFAELEIDNYIRLFTLNLIYRCLGGVNISFNGVFQFTDS